MFSVLRRSAFRWLWVGQTISLLGDGLIIVAVGLFVTRLTGDPSDVGLVLAAYVIPLVIFLLIGGVVADRFERATVMIVSDVARAVLHAVLALLIVSGTVRVWHMVLIGLAFGTSQAFFQPAYTGLVPQTVPAGEIQAAQSLSGVSRELSAFVSPAIATALVFSVGAGPAFALDSATFAVSALTLVLVRARLHTGAPATNVPARDGTAGSSVLVQLREGWSEVARRSWVWATIAGFASALLLALAPFFVLGPAVSTQVYGTDAVFGIVNTCWGVGTTAGAAIGSRLRPRYPIRAGLLASLPWPAVIALFALGPPVALLYAFAVVVGLGTGLFGVWWETALAQRIPPHLLSRVSAWDWMGSLGLFPLGYLLAGPIADAVGAAQVLVAGGLIGTGSFALALIPRGSRTLGRYEPEPTPEPASTARTQV